MIRLEEVTRYFGRTPAVDRLTMEVKEGEVCTLIGPSGCGKTTTLRMINRLVEPSSGRILVAGRDTRSFRPEQLRRSIGYAIQGVGLFPHFTVTRNIAVVPELLHWPKARIAARVDELLTLVGLPPSGYAHKYPSQLSGGEAQRVGVARALAADPPIILMDEPFGAVDPLTRGMLQVQFIRIQKRLKKTVIFVTHDLDEAIRLADRVAIMKAGRLVQFDTPEAVLSSPADKFVHDFVGTDRALKRLSRIPAGSHVKPAPAVPIDATAREAILACGECRWAWVVGDGGRLKGWIDMALLARDGSVKESAVLSEPEKIAITPSDTLRDALSRMLGLGVRSVPVVDEKGLLVGQLSLGDIEEATSTGRPV